MNLQSLDNWLEDLGDRVNPILVKETRQALKSRQFSGTFLLILGASLIASFAGVAFSGPGLDYRSAGPAFFLIYFVVLAFAVFVVVPFGAYRSLATEQEERTFELIAISTLKPQQIIGGKLLTAVIQMFIYFSAIGPFMVFTLLLKGIDAPTILFIVVCAAMASIGYSMTGLLLSTLSYRKAWQVFLSVAIIAGLLFAGVMSIPLAGILLSVPPPFREPYFWAAAATVLTIYATYFLLAFQVTASQLTFESDNGSTRVRLAMLLQFVLAVGWIVYWWMASDGEQSVLLGTSTMLMLHWFMMGSFLIGERPGLSQRVARQVPRNALGRGLSALLFPGPDTGLAFLAMVLLSLVALMGVGEIAGALLWPPPGRALYPTAFAMVMASYVFIYCGMGAFIVRLLRRKWTVPPIISAIITWILAVLGSAIPSFFALVLPSHQFREYRLWQISDPLSTTYEVHEMTRLEPLAFIPVALAALVLILNLSSMGSAISELARASSRRAMAEPAGNAVAPRTPMPEPITEVS